MDINKKKYLQLKKIYKKIKYGIKSNTLDNDKTNYSNESTTSFNTENLIGGDNCDTISIKLIGRADNLNANNINDIYESEYDDTDNENEETYSELSENAYEEGSNSDFYSESTSCDDEPSELDEQNIPLSLIGFNNNSDNENNTYELDENNLVNRIKIIKI